MLYSIVVLPVTSSLELGTLKILKRLDLEPSYSVDADSSICFEGDEITDRNAINGRLILPNFFAFIDDLVRMLSLSKSLLASLFCIEVFRF